MLEIVALCGLDLGEDVSALKQRRFVPLIKLIRGMSALRDKHQW